MVLNIFPRRERPQAAPSAEPEFTLPEPSPEALDEPGRCEVNGARWSVISAGGATSCAPSTGNGAPGRAFIGVYPD